MQVRNREYAVVGVGCQRPGRRSTHGARGRVCLVGMKGQFGVWELMFAAFAANSELYDVYRTRNTAEEIRIVTFVDCAMFSVHKPTMRSKRMLVKVASLFLMECRTER